LRAHYEGESFLNKQKEENYKLIENVHYKGERATFTFEYFTGILTKGYNDLQRYGEPVLKAKKVRDLLSKISDPKLESAKQAVQINAQYKNNFDLAINFLAESVETLDKSKVRMVAETQSHVNSAHGRGGRNNTQSGRTGGRTTRGRGRFGRGTRNHGGHGRGGRGRGRGKPDESTNTYIPPSEWNAMSPQQRQAFLQARAASRINAMTSIISINDDVSAISTPTGIQVPSQVAQLRQDQVSTAITTPQDNNGNNSVISGPFAGRASHRG
jgi:hypothetical protein